MRGSTSVISPQSLQQAAKTPPANASGTGTQRRISIRARRPRRNAAGAAAGPSFSAPQLRRRSRAVSRPLAARHRARCRSYSAAWLRRRPPTARPAAAHSRRAAFHRNPATAIPRSESGPPNRAHPPRVPGRAASRAPRRAGPSPKGWRRPSCAGSAPVRSARAVRASRAPACSNHPFLKKLFFTERTEDPEPNTLPAVCAPWAWPRALGAKLLINLRGNRIGARAPRRLRSKPRRSPRRPR